MIHPVTRAEDYLADCYITGWIVFETLSGDEKRRLCPWPIRWTQFSEEGLRDLLDQAEPVSAYKLRAERETGIEAEAAEQIAELVGEDKPDITDLGVVRSFRYPGGRLWTVAVVQHPEGGGAPALRFASGMRYIDLHKWPKAWADKPDDELAVMLRNAAPRPPTTTFDPDAPQRRWSDPLGHARAEE
jgi:hypothetical protein